VKNVDIGECVLNDLADFFLGGVLNRVKMDETPLNTLCNLASEETCENLLETTNVESCVTVK
jgi:hypothetical protein